MFDDLRKDGDASQFFQQEDELDPLLDAPVKKKGGKKTRSNRKFLGMTPFQRFVISAMFMALVSVLGLAFLLAVGVIVPF